MHTWLETFSDVKSIEYVHEERSHCEWYPCVPQAHMRLTYSQVCVCARVTQVSASKRRFAAACEKLAGQLVKKGSKVRASSIISMLMFD